MMMTTLMLLMRMMKCKVESGSRVVLSHMMTISFAASASLLLKTKGSKKYVDIYDRNPKVQDMY